MTDNHEHHQQHDEPEPDDLAARFTEAHWDERYSASERIWSGNPNPRLVERVAGLPPGTALDVGCGEGADALWLAERGWTVTGLDVSGVALDRADRHAVERGLDERCTWVKGDLLAEEPLPGRFDLVAASFLHLPDPEFTRVYRRLADAVLPGGSLVVLAHHPADAETGLRNPALSTLLFAPEKVTALLARGEWDVVAADAPTREVEGPDAEPVTVTDTVVHAVRRG